MSRPPRVRLEGWLLKKKSKDKSSILFKNENQRWFRIQEVEGSDQSELALCYYGSQKDKEAKGWIYLKDVTHIYDEKKTFTIVSDARTMTLEAQSPPEHMLWVQALGNYCQNASSGIKGKSSGAKEVESYKQDDRGSRNSSRRPSANNDDHQPPVAENKAPSPALTSLFSRYAQNTGDKSSFYNQPSSNAHPMPSLHSASEDYEYGEPELSGADQVTSTLDNNYSNYPNNSKNWKEDHRVKGYRGADVSSSATNRLHKFITKETVPDSGIAARRKEAKDEDDQEEEELESLTLSNENPSRARQRHRQQHLLQERQVRNSKEGRFIKPIDSSFTITADEGKRSDDDEEEEDNEENDRGRGRGQRGGAARGRGYSEDDDDDPSRSPPRRQTSSRSGREENEDDRTPPREGGEDDNDEDSRPRRNTSERGSGKRLVKAGAVPLPSNAPPRRARDALVEAEATQKTRRSIDDVLFKRGNNDSKTLSRENSARNSSANDSPPPQRGGGAGSSSDEEFDIKAEIKKYGPGSHNKEFMESTTSTTASTSSNNTSRPPRFPQPNSNKSSPYPSTTHPNAYQQPPPQRGSTPPPRVSHNPGAQVDRNFVTADWDEEEENKEEGKQGEGGSGRTKSYYQKTNYGSVQADENWLSENFDDN